MRDRPARPQKGVRERGRTGRPAQRAAASAIFVLCFALVPSFLAAPDGARLESDHFTLSYSDATTPEYAARVLDALETAYAILVVKDRFPAPDEPLEVLLLEMNDGELGSEYVTTDEDGQGRPVIEIATKDAMDDAAAAAAVAISSQDELRSTAAHELFHAIEDTLAAQGANDMSDLFFVESLATWAQEEAAPGADDYLESALDFLVGPDSLGFFHRTYDAGIFWVFVASRYGGAEAIREVLAATVAFDGRYAVEAAFQAKGVSFLDLWEAFSVSLAAERFPDAERVRTLFALRDPEAKSQTPRRWVELPPPVYHGTWDGGETTIDRVTQTSDAPHASEFAQDPPGSLLRVAHAYGIDFLHLTATVDRRLEISFFGEPGTEFRAAVVARRGSETLTWSLVPEKPVLVETPNLFDEIRILVTRGEAGTGTYRLTLREG